MTGRINEAPLDGRISAVANQHWVLHPHEADPPTLSPESQEPSDPHHRRRFRTVGSRISRRWVSGG